MDIGDAGKSNKNSSRGSGRAAAYGRVFILDVTIIPERKAVTAQHVTPLPDPLGATSFYRSYVRLRYDSSASRKYSFAGMQNKLYIGPRYSRWQLRVGQSRIYSVGTNESWKTA